MGIASFVLSFVPLVLLAGTVGLGALLLGTDPPGGEVAYGFGLFVAGLIDHVDRGRSVGVWDRGDATTTTQEAVRVFGGRVQRRGSVANHARQALEGPPNRRSEVPTRNPNLRVRLPFPLTRADIHAGLTHMVLTIMLGIGVALFPRSYIVGNIQDAASEFRGIHLQKLSGNSQARAKRLAISRIMAA